MAGDETKKEPIKVTDRRSFTADGQRRAPDRVEDAAPAPSRDQETIEGEGFALRRDRAARGEPSAAPPPVSFGAFIISLTTTAMIHLGAARNPATGKTELNLEAARELIDIIDVLREKTRGNLDPEESALVEDALYELRMTYTRAAARG